MILRLLPNQIPMYWEVIKFGATKADKVPIGRLEDYLNDLLQALLSSEAQCFIALKEDRCVQAVLITRLIENKLLKTQSLHIQCLYSFELIDEELQREAFNLIIKLAKFQKCNKITFDSNQKRVWEIAKNIGAVESYRSFVYDLKGG
jgi:hypothetical protein